MFRSGALLILVASVLFSCSKSAERDADPEDFASRVSTEAYLGTAKSTLHLHGYETFPSVEGEGSFNITNVSGDSVMVALICRLSTGDGFSFGIPGKQSGKAWSASFDTGNLVIQENGGMSGLMQTDKQEISWDGILLTNKMVLDVKIKYLKQEGNITEGSIINTHLDLARSGHEGVTTNNGCRVIVWETRSVFNIYSGGVDILRVPVCHPMKD
ncbi:hypothetical protein M8998_04130 [Sphingobacterium sp. lm-10]|uniref:hypothetical protein n=1 Tax=Sphingobacterium sp. lm-10 TaxID=2944904 RepID=UPI00202140B4|nr:hypothetical protein [Sphingobacterium sp. lm-10]MCL7987127.1 hypothetical protein [Sphingobacterium sp. lm-10]